MEILLDEHAWCSYIGGSKTDMEVVMKDVLQDLPEILREASEIIGGQRDVRWPTVDELEGFAIMVEDALKGDAK